MTQKETKLHTIDFSQFTPENLRPLFEAHKARVKEDLAKAIALENPTVEDFYGEESFDQTLTEELHWDAIDHISSTLSTPEYIDAYNELNEDRARLSLEVSRNKDLYKQYVKLVNSPDYDSYPEEVKRDLELTMLGYRLNGIELEGEAAKQFEENAVKLNEIGTKISNNHLLARQAWQKLITDKAELDGLSENGLELLASLAQAEGKEGYLLTLSPPVISQVMAYANNRELRKEFFLAYAYLASPDDTTGGKYDNTELVQQVYELKTAQAKLLGFNNHAERSLATKMAETPEEVITFLKELRQQAVPKGKEQLESLTAFAKETDGIEVLEPWDFTYYNTKYIKAKYDLDPEELRQYFPEDQVQKGLFEILSRLYGISFEVDNSVETYHQDVKFIRVYEGGELIAGLYLDVYARPTKRAGAWMNQAFGRFETATRLKLPVAYVCGNFTPPLNGKAALLSVGEVETLFHEMGHALHLILTKTKLQSLCGTNVEWDAVELPSQIHENWVYEPEALALISRHVTTGETLPKEKIDRLLELNKFNSGGIFLSNQVEYGLFDMELFSKDDDRKVHQVHKDVRTQTTDLIFGERKTWFPNTFEHIFTGGYSAGYYSYLWADVLAADAYAAYKEVGDIFSAKVAQSFKDNILATGGTRPTMQNYEKFRGRKPTPDALLVKYGIASDK
ncbi:hypothetical protein CKF54_03995 [Psittacicella hinzii]|uniref:oligopeptidase A n=1 Tax=Psittacicella hinzii TaxID=2028575 RepID=A0A3A1Y3P2_9GAMM|nr:M3 family metallopeptidase [Psittacicella hinzii]RIY32863.1 hypothetical protein CKF54_03995 [Psittacicella hinzii]